MPTLGPNVTLPMYINRAYFGLFGAPGRGSKYFNNKYLAQTIVLISFVEIQSPHYVGTWTLRIIELEYGFLVVALTWFVPDWVGLEAWALIPRWQSWAYASSRYGLGVKFIVRAGR